VLLKIMIALPDDLKIDRDGRGGFVVEKLADFIKSLTGHEALKIKFIIVHSDHPFGRGLSRAKADLWRRNIAPTRFCTNRAWTQARKAFFSAEWPHKDFYLQLGVVLGMLNIDDRRLFAAVMFNGLLNVGTLRYKSSDITSRLPE